MRPMVIFFINRTNGGISARVNWCFVRCLNGRCCGVDGDGVVVVVVEVFSSDGDDDDDDDGGGADDDDCCWSRLQLSLDNSLYNQSFHDSGIGTNCKM